MANFSSSKAAYEVIASRLWAELQDGLWTVDSVRARVERLSKYFQDGTTPARTSTSRLVLGDIDPHGSESFDPPEEEEVEEREVDEEEEADEDEDDEEEESEHADDEGGDIEPG